jgi:hypothetical protein
MNASLLTVIGSILAIIIGLWKYYGRKNAEKRRQADQARKDLDNANKNDNPSDFLDGFNRV